MDEATLTDKQQAFIEAYLTTARMNAAAAARAAGYSEHSAKWTGYELLQDERIRGEIDRRLAASRMSADEILARLEDQARGDWGALLDESGSIDLSKAVKEGTTHLIKAVTRETTRHGERVRVEMHDSQRALALLMKPSGLNQVTVKAEANDKLSALLAGMVAPWAQREAEGDG